MKQNREFTLKDIALSEGGYVNDPKDPGGPTDRGITQRTYDAWNKSKGRPPRTVRGISKTEADEIIARQYMDTVAFDSLPSGLDYAVADFSVNSGPSRAVRSLQQVLGVSQDGVVGLMTLSALRGKNIQKLINDYCDLRLAFMKRLKNWNHAKNGWTARVTKVRKQALELANG